MCLFLKVICSLAALYLVPVVFMALVQDRLLFPRWAVGPGAPLPPTAERLALHIGPGEQLIGVHLPPVEVLREGSSLVLAFGGNAWNAEDLAMHLHRIFPERDIVAFHYRGYTPSTGRPSARAILQDALAIHDDIAARLSPDRIVVVGLSIGAGPAAHLARSRPVAGLVLVTPFDNLRALAREHYPWLPVGLLLRHRMDVAGDLASVSAPVAVIAAADDTVVPPRRTEAVRLSARNLVAERTIAAAGHNDIYDRAEFEDAMQTALRRIEVGRDTR
ncbi:alpha/beta hydrolase [Sedimentitalea sp. HM32M-2]|uniref:alpha/beta hydrolase n=1 Tax=Sedimentitalea sp. HM32M-2 TaxID=3351566 RepID=UPI00364379A9